MTFNPWFVGNKFCALITVCPIIRKKYYQFTVFQVNIIFNYEIKTAVKSIILSLKIIIFGHFSRFLASYKISFSSLQHPIYNGKWNFERGWKRLKMTFLGLKIIIFGHFSRFLASFKISFSACSTLYMYQYNIRIYCTEVFWSVKSVI